MYLWYRLQNLVNTSVLAEGVGMFWGCHSHSHICPLQKLLPPIHRRPQYCQFRVNMLLSEPSLLNFFFSFFSWKVWDHHHLGTLSINYYRTLDIFYYLETTAFVEHWPNSRTNVPKCIIYSRTSIMQTIWATYNFSSYNQEVWINEGMFPNNLHCFPHVWWTWGKFG